MKTEEITGPSQQPDLSDAEKTETNSISLNVHSLVQRLISENEERSVREELILRDNHQLLHKIESLIAENSALRASIVQLQQDRVELQEEMADRIHLPLGEERVSVAPEPAFTDSSCVVQAPALEDTRKMSLGELVAKISQIHGPSSVLIPFELTDQLIGREQMRNTSVAFDDPAHLLNFVSDERNHVPGSNRSEASSISFFSHKPWTYDDNTTIPPSSPPPSVQQLNASHHPLPLEMSDDSASAFSRILIGDFNSEYQAGNASASRLLENGGPVEQLFRDRESLRAQLLEWQKKFADLSQRHEQQQVDLRHQKYAADQHAQPDERSGREMDRLQRENVKLKRMVDTLASQMAKLKVSQSTELLEQKQRIIDHLIRQKVELIQQMEDLLRKQNHLETALMISNSPLISAIEPSLQSPSSPTFSYVPSVVSSMLVSSSSSASDPIALPIS